MEGQIRHKKKLKSNYEEWNWKKKLVEGFKNIKRMGIKFDIKIK